MRILIVDDDPEIRATLAQILSDDGHEAVTVAEGREALAVVGADRFDLVLLDVVLPGIDGISLCVEIRRRSDVPIIILSARHSQLERVVSLRLGADAYVGKPFDVEELRLRVATLLRRAAPAAESEPLTFRSLRVEPRAGRAYVCDVPLALTPGEFKLLRALMRAGGSVIGRHDLAHFVNASDREGGRAIDVQVARLRRKLVQSGARDVAIATARGFGYRLAALEDEARIA